MRIDLPARLAPAVVFLLLLSAPAGAVLAPTWVAAEPLGSALGAGIGGFAVDAAGVTYATGTSGPSFNNDITTAAWAPDGTLLWSDTWDGAEAWHDSARDLALGPDGTVWVTGSTPDPSLFANIVLLQYAAASGELLQSVVYTTGPFQSESGYALTVDAEGNVYVAAGTTGDGPDAMTIKFDSAGIPQWRQVWDGPAFAPFSLD